jgi:hypothetical protein
MSTFYIKQNDTSPDLQVICKDYSESVVSVSGAFVKFLMRNKRTGEVQVNASGVVVDGPNGVIKYSWVTGDTDTVGRYEAEFQVTYADSSIETFPNNGFITVEVLDDIG